MRWSNRASEADWIAPLLAPFGTAQVSSVVPGGFDAYARILHPAEAADLDGDRTVRWAEVADWSATSLESDTQFHDLALPEHTPSMPPPWQNQGPREGTLTGEGTAALITVLREHTTTAQDCWFCVWDGYGWDNTVAYSVSTDPNVATESYRLPDVVPAEVRHGPRVRLPDRDYLLYTGPVEDALAFVDSQEQTPNLWWPADRAWCVASEIDLAWTYLAGPTDLINQVLADERVEAMPAGPQDTFHLRVTGRLAERLDEAVSDLLDQGRTRIDTSRGGVLASLEHSSDVRGDALWIHTSQHDPDGAPMGNIGPVWAGARTASCAARSTTVSCVHSSSSRKSDPGTGHPAGGRSSPGGAGPTL